MHGCKHQSLLLCVQSLPSTELRQPPFLRHHCQQGFNPAGYSLELLVLVCWVREPLRAVLTEELQEAAEVTQSRCSRMEDDGSPRLGLRVLHSDSIHGPDL